MRNRIALVLVIGLGIIGAYYAGTILGSYIFIIVFLHSLK